MKIQVTTASRSTGEAIQLWAEIEERPVSGLASFLLELGLAKAKRDGLMPKPVADAMRFRS